MLADGEFNQIDAMWTITGAGGSSHPYKILKNGYEGQSLQISRDEPGQVHFITQNVEIDQNEEYEFSFVAKWDKITEIKLGDESILSWSADYESFDWEKYSITIDASVIENGTVDLCVKGQIRGEMLI